MLLGGAHGTGWGPCFDARNASRPTAEELLGVFEELGRAPEPFEPYQQKNGCKLRTAPRHKSCGMVLALRVTA